MAEIIFTADLDEAGARQLRREAERGEAVRATPGIYVRTKGEPLETVLRRDWHKIVGRLVPAAVVTDRTGLEGQPWRERVDGRLTGDSYVFVSAPRSPEVISLPGLVISIRSGAGAVEGDIPLLTTTLAGPIRKLLDNLAPSRARSGPARTVGAAAVEAALEQLCVTHGEEHLNHVRDRARHLAQLIQREAEFEKLNGMISALMRTREARLSTIQGRARAEGAPLDPACIARLAKLTEFMGNRAPFSVPDRDGSAARRSTGAFFEAYFSNYIEGTEFFVRDAADIVFEGRIPDDRPEDGHDVLGAYHQLVEFVKGAAKPYTPDAFIAEIKERHQMLMKARPSVSPGAFKDRQNRAGETVFVAPELVEGTLRQGVVMLSGISDPFARALFIHLLLSDMHPFLDGNGRLSRIMMTKELVSAGLSRIVVPTVFRDDYLTGLRRLSRDLEPSIFVRSMEFCQKVSAACSSESVDDGLQSWAKAYAFCENGTHARLSTPNPALTIEERDGIFAPADYWVSLDQGSRFSI